MARILILFGTTDGHTLRIAESIGDTLRACGDEVDIVEARRDGPSPAAYSAIVVAASVHGGRYQRHVRSWVRTHAQALSGKPTAFVSVCLGVLQHDADVQREIHTIANRFLLATGWRPAITEIVAGALMYRKYNWLKRWVMKRIVAKAGGDTDTTRNYEYTDWNALRAFANRFGALVHEQGAPLGATSRSTEAA